MNKIPVFVISLKDSKRIDRITNRLNEIKINFKIIYGINGDKLEKKNRLHFFYDKEKTIENTGREFHPSEVGGCASHLKVYRYMIKNKIKKAIIMEDDAYPSSNLKDWINKNYELENNTILGFYAYPTDGLINKKPYKKFSDIKLNIHIASTQLCNCSCYQIDLETCKKIVELNKNKVSYYADWPFSRLKHNIKIAITIPFLVVIDDQNTLSLHQLRERILGEKTFQKLTKLKVLGKIFIFVKNLYYLFLIPFLLRKYKNYYLYYERFTEKIIKLFLNSFSNKNYNIKKIYHDKNFYASDISKLVK